MRRRILDSGFVVLVSVLLLAPASGLLVSGARETSRAEKRRLAQLPRLELSQGYLRELDAFLGDQFGFRDPLVALYSRLALTLGKSTSSRVTIGHRQWLFLDQDDTLGDLLGSRLVAEPEIDAIVKALESKSRKLGAKGIDYFFVLVPNKSTVYRTLLPQLPESTWTRADAVVHHLRQSEVSWLDLRPLLSMQSEESGALYNRFDTHWNQLGAALAQFEIAAWLERQGVEITPRRYAQEDFEWSLSEGGDLASMLGLQSRLSELRPVSRGPAGSWQIRQADRERPLPSGRPVQLATNRQSRPGRILVVHDSFFEVLRPFFAHYFGEAVFAWSALGPEGVEALAAEVEPDLVLEIRVERLLDLTTGPRRGPAARE